MPGAPAPCRASCLHGAWRGGPRCATPWAGRVALRSGVVHWTRGAAVPGIAATMTGVEAITFGLAAALAVGAITFRASVPPAAAMALLTAAALGFFLALLH